MNALLLLTAALAAQVTVTAEVNKTALPLDDQLVLAVTVSGSGSLPDPIIPSPANFMVQGSGSSTNLQMINGRMTASAVYTFVLTPRAVGRSTIPPISVVSGGKTISTDPIEIDVLPSGSAAKRAQPRPAQGSNERGPDAFMTASLDKKRVHVGEQATLSIRVYWAVEPLGQGSFEPPKLRGFLPEDLPERRIQLESRGRFYYGTEIRKALFPAEAGRLAIEAAKARINVPRALNPLDPLSPGFVERFFNMGVVDTKPLDLASEPLTLQVDPLPAEGRPAGFNGAVGDWRIELRADRRTLKVGDAVNLTLTLAGVGNPKLLPEAPLPELREWRLYDPVTSIDVDAKGETVTGTKTLKYVAVPRVSGDLTIPAVPFVFFEPKSGKYRRVETAPITFKVAPGDPSAAAGASAVFTKGAGAITTLSEDIRHIKTTGPSGFTRALELIAAAGPAHAAPALFFAACAGLAWRRRLLEADPRRARARGALRAAEERVAKGAPHEALAGFLGDKLGEPAAALTQKRAAELLAARGLDPAAMKRLWTELEARRYAPGGGASDDLKEPLLELLRRLDKELA